MGENGLITFLTLNTKIGGQAMKIKEKNKCLTEDQGRHIYKKVELGNIINVDVIKLEMDQDIDRIDDTNGEINPHHEIMVNRAERDDTFLSHMCAM